MPHVATMCRGPPAAVLLVICNNPTTTMCTENGKSLFPASEDDMGREQCVGGMSPPSQSRQRRVCCMHNKVLR